MLPGPAGGFFRLSGSSSPPMNRAAVSCWHETAIESQYRAIDDYFFDGIDNQHDDFSFGDYGDCPNAPFSSGVSQNILVDVRWHCLRMCQSA